MNALLDTHTLIWAGGDRAKLSKRAIQILEASENVLLVSAASAWEIATKVRLGKMPEAIVLERDFVSILASAGYLPTPVTLEQALAAGRLPGKHRDPFDRMIAAQALDLKIPVISSDAELDGFGIERIW